MGPEEGLNGTKKNQINDREPASKNLNSTGLSGIEEEKITEVKGRA